jgi:hypothetical protein
MSTPTPWSNTAPATPPGRRADAISHEGLPTYRWPSEAGLVPQRCRPCRSMVLVDPPSAWSVVGMVSCISCAVQFCWLRPDTVTMADLARHRREVFG